MKILKINQNAFTMIEIIVVAMIVGVIGMMSIPSMLKMMNRSYAQDARANLIAIYAAQQNYAQNHNGVYLACAIAPPALLSDCINNTVTGLGLNIVSSGGLKYSCETASNTCSATAAAGSQAGTFVMTVALNNVQITVGSSTPVYCSPLGSNFTTHNPCCVSGSAPVAGGNCP